MKGYISLLGLFSRYSWIKLTLVFLAVIAVDTSSFLLLLERDIKVNEILAIDEYIASPVIQWTFAFGLLLLSVILCISGMQTSSKTGYTLRRLSVKESGVFAVQAVYNILVLLAFWAVQLLCVYLFSLYYAKLSETDIGVQTVYIAFYRERFLHSLLPLSDVMLWVRNFVLFAFLGLSCAYFTYRQRRGTFSYIAVAASAYAFFLFGMGIGNIMHIIIFVIAAVILSGYMINAVIKKEESYDS